MGAPEKMETTSHGLADGLAPRGHRERHTIGTAPSARQRKAPNQSFSRRSQVEVERPLTERVLVHGGMRLLRTQTRGDRATVPANSVTLSVTASQRGTVS